MRLRPAAPSLTYLDPPNRGPSSVIEEEQEKAAITACALPAPIAGGWRLLIFRGHPGETESEGRQVSSDVCTHPGTALATGRAPRGFSGGCGASPLTTARLTLESAWGQVPSASRVQAVPGVSGPVEALPPPRSLVSPGAGPEAARWRPWQWKARVTPTARDSHQPEPGGWSPRLRESTRRQLPPTLEQRPDALIPDRK